MPNLPCHQISTACSSRGRLWRSFPLQRAGRARDAPTLSPYHHDTEGEGVITSLHVQQGSGRSSPCIMAYKNWYLGWRRAIPRGRLPVQYQNLWARRMTAISRLCHHCRQLPTGLPCCCSRRHGVHFICGAVAACRTTARSPLPHHQLPPHLPPSHSYLTTTGPAFRLGCYRTGGQQAGAPGCAALFRTRGKTYF